MVGTRTRVATDDFLVRGLQCLSAFPAAFLLSLVSLMLYARSRLGLWPTAHLNDPKDIGVSYGVFYLMGFGLFLGFLITPLCVAQRGPAVRPGRSAILWSVFTLAMWSLFLLAMKCDPGGYVEWVFD